MHISKRARLCTALLTTLLLVFALAAARPVRSDTGYAALLVIFGPDDYHSECVALPGDMTPLDLLKASTLELTVEPGPTGEGLCSIDGVGCVYPDEPCFCQCSAEACPLWNAWHQDGSLWVVTTAIDERIVPHGDVEAWVWSDGMEEPPSVSFADICTGVALNEPLEAETGDYPVPPAAPPETQAPYPGPDEGSSSWQPPSAPVAPPQGPQAPLTVTSTPETIPPVPSPTNTRFSTPTWLSSTTSERRRATAAVPDTASTSPTSVPTLAVTLSAQSGTPTNDQVAMLVGTAAARSRATAIAQRAGVDHEKRSSAWAVALAVIAACVAVYALLLWQQRRAVVAASSTPKEPQLIPPPQGTGAAEATRDNPQDDAGL